MGPPYAGARRRYRVKRYRSHLVYYRRQANDILIVRILHVRQDSPVNLD